jgi:hypothetical protein
VSFKVIPKFPDFSSADASKIKNKRELLDKHLGDPTSSVAESRFRDFAEMGPDAEIDGERIEDWSLQLRRSKPLIQLHIQKRISLLFTQAIVCHNTSYEFRVGKVMHNGRQAHKIGDEEFQAAHSATLPCLYARSLVTGKEKVYLYRSDYYDESSSTIDMVKAVNDADRAIDELYSISKLREDTVDLLNEVARGETNPMEMTKEFIDTLIDQIDISLKRATSDEVKDVLRIYRKEAVAISLIVNKPETFDTWLYVDMKDPDHNKVADIVARLKDGEDVTKEEVLSVIKKKLDELPARILHDRLLEKNEDRVPNHFHDYYQLEILERLPDPCLPIVEEAWGVTLEDLRSECEDFQNMGPTEALIEDNIDKIEEVLIHVIKLTRYYRGKVTDLSSIKGLSPERQATLRPGIHDLGCGMIKDPQTIGGKIKNKIDDARERLELQLSPKFKVKDKNKVKKQLELFFYNAIFMKAESEESIKNFCKLLNISYFDIELNVSELKYDESAHEVLEENVERINALSKKIIDTASKVFSHPTKVTKLKESIIKLHNRLNPEENARFTTLFYNRLYLQEHSDPKVEKRRCSYIESASNLTHASIEKKIRRGWKVTPSEAFVEDHIELVEDTVSYALHKIKRLQKKTEVFRCKVFLALRNANGMNQNKFKAIYKKKFPGFPMSDGTLSNLENGRKPIDDVIIGQVCEIFNQKTSLFYPSHFADKN